VFRGDKSNTPPLKRTRHTANTVGHATSKMSVAEQSRTKHSLSIDSSKVATKPSSVAEALQLMTDDVWFNIVDKLSLKGMPRSLAMNASLQQQTESRLILVVDPRFQMLCNETNHKKLTESLSTYFGQSITVEIENIVSNDLTPEMLKAQYKMVRIKAAEKAMMADVTIKALCAECDAEISNIHFVDD